MKASYIFLLFVATAFSSSAFAQAGQDGWTIKIVVKDGDTALVNTPPVLITKSTQARFNGDMQAFIKQNLRYPADAKNNKTTCVVKLFVDITTTGSIDDIVFMNRVSPGIDSEAIRIVRAMPLWEPARIASTKLPVQTSAYIDIPFKLP